MPFAAFMVHDVEYCAFSCRKCTRELIGTPSHETFPQYRYRTKSRNAQNRHWPTRVADAALPSTTNQMAKLPTPFPFPRSLVRAASETAVPHCDEHMQPEGHPQVLALRQQEAQLERLPHAKRELDCAEHEVRTLQREVSYLEMQLQEYSDYTHLLINRNRDDEVRVHNALHFFG
jgi:hypothetical protein